MHAPVRTGILIGLLTAVALLTTSCVSGESIPRTDTEEPEPPLPVPEPDPQPEPVVPEPEPEPEAAPGREFNSRCTANDQCQSRWCVAFNDVNVCSRLCLVDDQCPNGWSCQVIGNTEPDTVSVCVPPDSRLCRACNTSEECPDGDCYETDGLQVCGIACDPEDEQSCLPGYTCRAVTSVDGFDTTQCVPSTGSCSCNANTDNTGEVRGCEVSNEIGSCRGRQTCEVESGWMPCMAPTPTPEVCDGEDNDCNTLVDDVAGVGDMCASQQEINGRPEACQGVNVCDLETGELACTADTPSAEACNALDDDCDGRVDEAFDLNSVCDVGVGACNRTGITKCDGDGASVVCSAMPGEPTDEVCNGLDDDCDGAIDEAFPALFEPCTVGMGACLRAGIQLCSEAGDAVVCSAELGVPGEEQCNALDDDCDGVVDEGFAGLRTPCAVGVGMCLRQGITVCAADGAGVQCDAEAGIPAEEQCDGLDNDCDGALDEDFVELGRACAVGVGLCLRQGVQVCSPDGAGVQCNVVAGAPNEDICNGADDDCDGAADEDYPAVNRPCTSGEGACRQAGVQVCGADQRSVSCDAVAAEPDEETCNGVDDDCDGVADEEWPVLGQVCQIGVGQCRRSGVFTCDPEDPEDVRCDAEVVEGGPVDRCDYQDDDCDGLTDEGFVDGDGIYATIQHCGACGTDCTTLWAPDPAAFGVVPRCVVGAGIAQCAFDCLPGFRDADEVPNNGCELEIDDDSIYVSTPFNGGEDQGGCGTIDRPCATIGFGIDQAAALERARVRVSDGVYRESVTLRPGIDVLGGHQRTTWVRNPALNVTIIEGRTPMGARHRWAVWAEGINAPTTLSGFTITGESPLLEGNAYGVYVRDSGAALVLSNNRIFAGDGGRGADGESGESGAPGALGGAGRASQRTPVPNPCAEDPANNYGDPDEGFPGTLGGRGGVRVCGEVPVHGGNGGYTSCPTRDRQEGSGGDGRGAEPGVGGDGGWGFLSFGDGVCQSSDAGPADPGAGRNGVAGSDGRGGEAGADGAVVDGHWGAPVGASGVGGTPGSGGGGGGGAAGVAIIAEPLRGDLGASGGGGGSGGCAGAQGGGGGAGGGSFGVFITYSAEVAPDDLPRLSNNIIARGLGGAGGNGGNGGGGGEGGAGGQGGPRGDVELAFCSFRGGQGGQGGRGGHGGGGGGGIGGVSFDIFLSGAPDPGYGLRNIFELPADVLTHGRGGRGGNSSNTLIGLGENGEDGRSGNVGIAR